VSALREAGAVIVGKAVTTEFASTEPRGTRNPHDLRRTPGGSSSGSAAAVAAWHGEHGARHPGDRLDHSPGQLLRLYRLQGLGRRTQSRRQLRRLEPERDRRAGDDVGGRLGRSPTRSPFASAAIPAIPACTGRQALRRRENRSRLAFLETAGWAAASPGAKAAMADALVRFKAAGIDVLTRQSHAAIAAVDAAIAQGAAALDADQYVGVALAAQYLP
jgi:Asp-tRNA(Asn)/Glu-tRNA(Gln) amidotransferase A subunit family amidase